MHKYLKMNALLGSFIVFSFFGSVVLAATKNIKDLETEVLGDEASTATALTAPLSKEEGRDNDYDKDIPVIVEDPKAVEFPELDELKEAIRGPEQIPNEHILVVQKRYIRKENKHELSPFVVGLQPADSFRVQTEFGFSYAYHFNEVFAVEFVHAAFFSNYSTGLAENILSAANLATARVEPVYSLGSTLQWTPLRSKAATLRTINYFEGYFILGGGVTKTEVSQVALVMTGLGFRAFVSRVAALKIELRDYIDIDQGEADHRFNVALGASVFFGGDSP